MLKKIVFTLALLSFGFVGLSASEVLAQGETSATKEVKTEEKQSKKSKKKKKKKKSSDKSEDADAEATVESSTKKKTKKKKKSDEGESEYASYMAKSVSGVVKIDGAMIYRSPDFDSEIIDYLPLAKEVKIARKAFGPFMLIEYKPNTYGFISDVDVGPKGNNPSESNSSSDGDQENMHSRFMEDSEQEDKQFDDVLFLKRQAGLFAGMLNYQTVFSQTAVKESMNVMGIKFSGKDLVGASELPMDITVGVAPQAPKYFQDKFGAVSAKGMLLLVEGSVLFPFTMSETSSAYGGLGGYYIRTSYDVSNGTETITNTESRFGAVVGFGFAISAGKIVLKVEPKYYLGFSGGSHTGIFGALQILL